MYYKCVCLKYFFCCEIQLIRECKEVLRGAAIVKQYYQHMVSAVLCDDQEAEEKFATDLEQFDYDMKCMLDVRFNNSYCFNLT